MISVSICSPNPGLAALWDDLATRASANVFMNPAGLGAAAETNFSRIRVLLAWGEATAPPRLVGLWALQIRKIAPFWPAMLEALPFNYAFHSSPVVEPGFVAAVIPAFLNAIKEDPSLPNVINLSSFDGDSGSCAALIKALGSRRGELLELSESARPFVTREFGVKRSGSTRKKLRQDWNRLSALGTVDVVNDRTPAATQAAFEEFLVLEIESWKGARGTALLCDDEDAEFVRRLVGDLAARNDASVALLRVDGRVIAAQVLMYCGTTAYTWKTAYNSDYAKYSPGMLLIDKVTDELFTGAGIEAIDSCSAEGSFMGQLWTGRRRMVDMLVDVGPGKSTAFAMEVRRQLGFLWLKGLRDRVRAGALTPQPKKIGLAGRN